MKMVKKALAVTLSLVLCGSLVAPSFAATFAELNAVINGGSTGTAGISVSTNNNGSRVVDIHEDVTYNGGDDQKQILVQQNNDVTLNMNGYTIDGGNNGSSVINVQPNATLTVNGGERTDEATGETVTGTITGGGSEDSYAKMGGGVCVSDSTAHLNGVTITGNYGKQGGGVYAGRDSTVTITDSVITGNHADSGGGVNVNSDTTVTITDSEISDNVAGGPGGGIYIAPTGTADLDGVKISGNNAAGYGGGINTNGTLIVKDSTIADNTATSGGGISNHGATAVKGSTITGNQAIDTTDIGLFGVGGGIYTGSQNEFTIVDTEITGNSATAKGGGIGISGSGTVLTMNGGAIYSNQAEVADDVYIAANSTVTLPDASGTLADGTAVTGWYFDYNGWGDPNGSWPYWKYDTVSGYWGSEGFLKAAHDEYFAVTDGDGNVLAEVEKGTEIDVSKLEEPTREGYTFIGWADADGNAVETLTVTGGITLVAQWKEDEPEQPTTPDNPAVTPDVPVDPTVEIDEPDVPLAGMPIKLEPEDKLTRAQLIAILHWMDGEPAAELATFLDVLASSDYAEAIGWAQENGITFGVGGNRFAPEEHVTRGQLIDFLNRYAAYVGSDLVLELDGDADEVLTWAQAEEIINDFFARL